MDYLRQGIGLRGYAQKDPKQEYKREAFELFSAMLERVRYEVVGLLARVQVREESEIAEMEARRRQAAPMEFLHPQALAPAQADAGADQAPEAAPDSAPVAPPQPVVRTGPKVGRNDPCPCGSGKKYKQCHGKLR
jgi:preprotein translocase subunit SecA